jgi:thioredoxin 1
MTNFKQVGIVAALIIAVAVAIVAKQGRGKATTSKQSAETSARVQTAGAETALPRLVDLGADKCIPCKMMAPILEELKKTYAGKLDVEFIDVWKNQGAGQQYGIRVIPTQIFFSSDGKELFRHEGFFSKEDILAKWKEFSVELSAGIPHDGTTFHEPYPRRRRFAVDCAQRSLDLGYLEHFAQPLPLGQHPVDRRVH